MISVHVTELARVAANAAEMLRALEMIAPQVADKIHPVRIELARAAWAVMGRPAPINEGAIQK